MDIFEIVKIITQKLKLFVLYWRRIVFVKNSFNVAFLTKLKANICGGFTADQWALYSLDLKKKKEYLSEFDWYRSRYINDPFDVMLNNKVITTEALRQYIRIPEIYAVNVRGDTFDFCGNKLSPREAVDVIKAKEDCFLKPFGKGKGVGVSRFRCAGGKFYRDGEKIAQGNLEKMLRVCRDWYLSETVRQHEYAEKLYDKTTNTIRLITVRNPRTQKLKVLFAVQRVGTSATVPVDNASKGGLVCKIDLETGRLSEARCLKNRNVYEKHPDSGAEFRETTIPGWMEMKEEILNLAGKFPYLHFVAWDILKAENGQNCVIEANTSSGVNIIQLWGGQRGGELGDFYRFHKVIK